MAVKSQSVVPVGITTLTVILLVVFTPQPANSSGQLAIRLVNYTYPTGEVKLANGGTACCDTHSPVSGTCDASLCDPQFELCVTTSVRRRSCEYFNVTSRMYRNSMSQNFLTRAFSENELGSGPLAANRYLTPSSLAIASKFVYWDGVIYITLRVLESDQTQRYLITEAAQPYTVTTPAPDGKYEWRTITLNKDGVTLNMEISIQCDQGFRDMYCYCQDIDTPSEHTKCTREGNRVCLEGWTEPPGMPGPIKCLTAIAPCSSRSNPCRNNATCGTYNDGSGAVSVCSCLEGFTGQFCENKIATTSFTTASTTTTTRATTQSTPKPISAATKISTGYMFSVSENDPIGTVIGQLNSGRGLEYGLFSNELDQPFTISHSGLVTVTDILDREAQDHYLIHSIVLDPNNATSKPTAVSILVKVTDVNDNAPVFATPALFVTVDESTQPGSPLAIVTATDADAGANGEVHYAMTNSNTPFYVTASRGEIVLAKSLLALDDLQPDYELVVMAVDHGVVPLTSTMTVTVSVRQETFKFAQNNYVCRVADNVTVGTVVTTVQASLSGGSDKIAYEIEDQLSKLFFQINDQGEITVTRALVGFSLDNFEMSVAAYEEPRDPNKKAVTKVQFTIVHTPTFEKPGVHDVTIRSDLPVGSIVDQLHALLNGRKSHEIRYIATGDAAASSYFTVDSSSGLITVARSLLSGTDTVYNLTVEAVNSLGGSSSVVVAIAVQRNLFAPVFVVPHYQATIRINHTAPVGSIVYTVSAIDNDVQAPQNMITYSMIGDEEAKNYFAVDSNAGQIRVTQSLALQPAQLQKTCKLVLEATDGGGYSSRAEVNIQVLS